VVFKGIHPVLLKQRKDRLQRRELLLFWDFLGLYISVGYDLAYAWPEVIKFLQTNKPESFLECFCLEKEDETLTSLLLRLEKDFEPVNHRFMFTALRQLYLKGAPLMPAIRSFSTFVRREIEQSFESHLRESPIRANICLLVFFLPPTLVLLFSPLILYLRALW